MLELIGREYVIDHVLSEHRIRMEKKGYRCYSTDVLKAIAEVLGVTINNRYADYLVSSGEDTEKTADEIALEVIRRAGLRGKTNESI